MPAASIPNELDEDTEYFSLYANTGRQDVGRISSGWVRVLSRCGFAPPSAVWDFVTIALAVAAADIACHRQGSADGWTRMIQLDVALHEPDCWIAQRSSLERTFRFLTGDFWTLNFLEGGVAPPASTALRETEADCVALLSGGLDSLVGGIDLNVAGRTPLFVSQMAKGDSETQKLFARTLDGGERHFQWNHRITVPHTTERSTRGRSIVFLAFALLASTTLPAWQAGDTTELVIPENGFISLNIALNAGRFGSYSTKTTHPTFLDGIQQAFDAVGLRVRLTRPYQFATKGELLRNCSDGTQLVELARHSTSCGRFGYYNYTHCGRCVPCLVRRASFLQAGIADPTSRYIFPDLATAGRERGPNDIGSVAAAYVNYSEKGVDRLIGSALSFAQPGERTAYSGVFARGMDELGELLRVHNVL
ncbi:Qat anti-phage system QueC-like protein QatC [Burkholderia sp. Ax-1719]|uniref:Qat anti-phage system QueC-like protein QatC n=1 Tax=Burkholderia sp. Ax-1719 TaxID=2608334 RepID=UPI001F0404D8|nr:Qat anti-phage system QueC-like protein QatC [Burkholderia sp. Ax-1719]